MTDQRLTASLLLPPPPANKVAIVAGDNNHTVYVYDWAAKPGDPSKVTEPIANGKGSSGVPPQVRREAAAGKRQLRKLTRRFENAPPRCPMWHVDAVKVYTEQISLTWHGPPHGLPPSPPSQVYGVVWDTYATLPDNGERFCTYGARHAKVWGRRIVGLF